MRSAVDEYNILAPLRRCNILRTSYCIKHPTTERHGRFARWGCNCCQAAADCARRRMRRGRHQHRTKDNDKI